MNFTPRMLIGILAIAGIIGIGLLAYMTMQKEPAQIALHNTTANQQEAPDDAEACDYTNQGLVWCEEKQRCVNLQSENCKEIPIADYLADTAGLGELSGSILFIKDGDVWKSDSEGKGAIKLIDRDAVTKASFSPNRNRIAYSIVYPSTETVTNSDGTKEEVELTDTFGAEQTLYLANGVGAESREVKEGVVRWGWVPDSDLLWYETSSLYQYFSWGYFGNNDIWIYDTDKLTATQLRESKSNQWGMSDFILGIKWSEDGSKVLFATPEYTEDGKSFKSNALHVVDRATKEEISLLAIPWVGGDRGGAAPIPSFYWSEDAKKIYTGFTPVLEATMDYKTDDYLASLQSNYVSILEIPLNGDTPKELVPQETSIIFNEEHTPQLNFSADRSKVLYFTVYPDAAEDDAFRQYGSGNSNIVVTDTRSNESYLIDDSFVSWQENILVRDGSLSSCITDEGVYLFRLKEVDSAHWLTLTYFDFQENAPKEIASIPAPYDDDRRLELSDIKFFPEKNSVLFRANGVVYKVVDTEIGTLLEDVEDAEYLID